jgi:starch synthase
LVIVKRTKLKKARMEVKPQKFTYKPFPVWIRAIALILIVTFMCQDIVWAHPDLFAYNGNNNKLAAKSFFSDPESLPKAYALEIERLIEKTAGNLLKDANRPSASLSLNDIRDVVDIIKSKYADWIETRKLQFSVSDDEVLISYPPGYMLRYFKFDPERPNRIKYNNRIISSAPVNKDALLYSQLLEVKGLPAPKSSVLSDVQKPEQLKHPPAGILPRPWWKSVPFYSAILVTLTALITGSIWHKIYDVYVVPRYGSIVAMAAKKPVRSAKKTFPSEAQREEWRVTVLNILVAAKVLKPGEKQITDINVFLDVNSDFFQNIPEMKNILRKYGAAYRKGILKRKPKSVTIHHFVLYDLKLVTQDVWEDYLAMPEGTRYWRVRTRKPNLNGLREQFDMHLALAEKALKEKNLVILSKEIEEMNGLVEKDGRKMPGESREIPSESRALLEELENAGSALVYGQLDEGVTRREDIEDELDSLVRRAKDLESRINSFGPEVTLPPPAASNFLNELLQVESLLKAMQRKIDQYGIRKILGEENSQSLRNLIIRINRIKARLPKSKGGRAIDPEKPKPEGAAIEAGKIEWASITGVIFALPAILLCFYYNEYPALQVFLYIHLFMSQVMPVVTAKYIDHALRHEYYFPRHRPAPKKAAPDKDQPSDMKEAAGREDALPGKYKLISPFRNARKIGNLYYHDPDSRGKISYYSYTVEKNLNLKMGSALYVDKKAMSYVPRLIQYIIYFHEWLHSNGLFAGGLRIKTELIAVPMTFSAVWALMGCAAPLFTLGAPQDGLNVSLAILFYNALLVPLTAMIMASLIGIKESDAGHYVLDAARWWHLDDAEIDNEIMRYAHDATFDPGKKRRAYWRDWLLGNGGDNVACIHCPNRLEDIVVVKAAYEPGAHYAQLEKAIRMAHERSLALIIADKGLRDIRPGEEEADYRIAAEEDAKNRRIRIDKVVEEAREILKRTDRDAVFVKIDARFPEYDIRRMKGLLKLFKGRRSRIVKETVEQEAVAGEVAGQINRFKTLLKWLPENGYDDLVLTGDIYGKLEPDSSHETNGFEAVDVLMEHMKSDNVLKVHPIMGGAEHLFLNAMFANNPFAAMWTRSRNYEGLACLESLDRLAKGVYKGHIDESAEREDIEKAKGFERILTNIIVARGADPKDETIRKEERKRWFRCHPKLLDLAEFTINNMHFVYYMDKLSRLHTLCVSPESFSRDGVKGLEALDNLENEFKKRMSMGLRLLRLRAELWNIMYGNIGEADFSKISNSVNGMIGLIDEELSVNRGVGNVLIPSDALYSMKNLLFTIKNKIGIGAFKTTDIKDASLKLDEEIDRIANPLYEMIRDQVLERPKGTPDQGTEDALLFGSPKQSPRPDTEQARREIRSQRLKMGINTSLTRFHLKYEGAEERDYSQYLEAVRVMDKRGNLSFLMVDDLPYEDRRMRSAKVIIPARRYKDDSPNIETMLKVTNDKLGYVRGKIADYNNLLRGVPKKSWFELGREYRNKAIIIRDHFTKERRENFDDAQKTLDGILDRIRSEESEPDALLELMEISLNPGINEAHMRAIINVLLDHATGDPDSQMTETAGEALMGVLCVTGAPRKYREKIFNGAAHCIDIWIAGHKDTHAETWTVYGYIAKAMLLNVDFKYFIRDYFAKRRDEDTVRFMDEVEIMYRRHKQVFIKDRIARLEFLRRILKKEMGQRNIKGVSFNLELMKRISDGLDEVARVPDKIKTAIKEGENFIKKYGKKDKGITKTVMTVLLTLGIGMANVGFEGSATINFIGYGLLAAVGVFAVVMAIVSHMRRGGEDKGGWYRLLSREAIALETLISGGAITYFFLSHTIGLVILGIAAFYIVVRIANYVLEEAIYPIADWMINRKEHRRSVREDSTPREASKKSKNKIPKYPAHPISKLIRALDKMNLDEHPESMRLITKNVIMLKPQPDIKNEYLAAYELAHRPRDIVDIVKYRKILLVPPSNCALLNANDKPDAMAIALKLTGCTAICVKATDDAGTPYFGIAHIFCQSEYRTDYLGGKNEITLADDFSCIHEQLKSKGFKEENIKYYIAFEDDSYVFSNDEMLKAEDQVRAAAGLSAVEFHKRTAIREDVIVELDKVTILPSDGNEVSDRPAKIFRWEDAHTPRAPGNDPPPGFLNGFHGDERGAMPFGGAAGKTRRGFLKWAAAVAGAGGLLVAFKYLGGLPGAEEEDADLEVRALLSRYAASKDAGSLDEIMQILLSRHNKLSNSLLIELYAGKEYRTEELMDIRDTIRTRIKAKERTLADVSILIDKYEELYKEKDYHGIRLISNLMVEWQGVSLPFDFALSIIEKECKDWKKQYGEFPAGCAFIRDLKKEDSVLLNGMKGISGSDADRLVEKLLGSMTDLDSEDNWNLNPFRFDVCAAIVNIMRSMSHVISDRVLERMAAYDGDLAIKRAAEDELKRRGKRPKNTQLVSVAVLAAAGAAAAMAGSAGAGAGSVLPSAKEMPVRDIMFVSPEIFPFSKSGGVADVISGLGIAEANKGQRVKVVTLAYEDTLKKSAELGIRDSGKTVSVYFNGEMIDLQIHTASRNTAAGELEVYLLSCLTHPEYTRLLYDMSSSPERGVTHSLAQAVILSQGAAALAKEFKPDIVHLHDWMAALTAPYLKVHPWYQIKEKPPKILYSIHNLAYRGDFYDRDYSNREWGLGHVTGLDIYGQYPTDRYGIEFNPDGTRGGVAICKGGLLYSDKVLTPAHNYEKEIQTKVFGFSKGLYGLMQTLKREGRLESVEEGINYDEYDPAKDPHIYRNYSEKDWRSGKEENKTRLQEESQGSKSGSWLETDKDSVLIGMVCRADVSQKGIDIALYAIKEILKKIPNAQFVFLSHSDNPGNEELAKQRELLKDAFPGRVFFNFIVDKDKNETMERRIFAAADIIIAPSRVEPFGITPLNGYRYGAIPVAHKVGGHADTIIDFNEDPSAGTGFIYDGFHPDDTKEQAMRASEGLKGAVFRAYGSLFDPRNPHSSLNREALVERVMALKRYNWSVRAVDFLGEYEKLLSPAQGPQASDAYADLPRPGSLEWIYKKIGIKNHPIFTAPIYEEFAKVGVPFLALQALDAALPDPSLFALKIGVFAGLMLTAGIAFIVLHIFNERGPPFFKSYTIFKKISLIWGELSKKEKILVFAAPIAATISGFIFSAVFFNDPRVAVIVSMLTHAFVINFPVFILKRLKIDARYASIGTTPAAPDPLVSKFGADIRSQIPEIVWLADEIIGIYDSTGSFADVDMAMDLLVKIRNDRHLEASFKKENKNLIPRLQSAMFSARQGRGIPSRAIFDDIVKVAAHVIRHYHKKYLAGRKQRSSLDEALDRIRKAKEFIDSRISDDTRGALVLALIAYFELTNYNAVRKGYFLTQDEAGKYCQEMEKLRLVEGETLRFIKSDDYHRSTSGSFTTTDGLFRSAADEMVAEHLFDDADLLAREASHALRRIIQEQILEERVRDQWNLIIMEYNCYFNALGMNTNLPLLRAKFHTRGFIDTCMGIHSRLAIKGYGTDRVVYPMSGSDISTALLMSDAETLEFYDVIPFVSDMKDEEAELFRISYLSEKTATGYSSSELLRAIGSLKKPMLWELEYIGASDITCESGNAALGEDPLAYYIRFLWSYDGKSPAKRRTVIFRQKELGRRTDYSSIIGDNGSTLYLQKAELKEPIPIGVRLPNVVIATDKVELDGYERIQVKDFVADRDDRPAIAYKGRTYGDPKTMYVYIRTTRRFPGIRPEFDSMDGGDTGAPASGFSEEPPKPAMAESANGAAELEERAEAAFARFAATCREETGKIRDCIETQNYDEIEHCVRQITYKVTSEFEEAALAELQMIIHDSIMQPCATIPMFVVFIKNGGDPQVIMKNKQAVQDSISAMEKCIVEFEKLAAARRLLDAMDAWIPDGNTMDASLVLDGSVRETVERAGIAVRSISHSAEVLDMRTAINHASFAISASAKEYDLVEFLTPIQKKYCTEVITRIREVSALIRPGSVSGTLKGGTARTAIGMLKDILEDLNAGKDLIDDEIGRTALHRTNNEISNKEQFLIGISAYFSEAIERMESRIEFAEGIRSKERASIREILERACLEKEHVAKEFILPENSDIVANRCSLSSVISSFIDNAQRFALKKNDPSKGMKPEVKVEAYIRNGCVEIVISDNGEGVNPEYLAVDTLTGRPRLFNLNESTRTPEEIAEEGAGLGMAEAWYLIVKDMGGTIDVQSKEGKGAKFTIRLPVKTPARSPALAGEAAFVTNDAVSYDAEQEERDLIDIMVDESLPFRVRQRAVLDIVDLYYLKRSRLRPLLYGYRNWLDRENMMEHIFGGLWEVLDMAYQELILIADSNQGKKKERSALLAYIARKMGEADDGLIAATEVYGYNANVSSSWRRPKIEDAASEATLEGEDRERAKKIAADDERRAQEELTSARARWEKKVAQHRQRLKVAKKIAAKDERRAQKELKRGMARWKKRMAQHRQRLKVAMKKIIERRVARRRAADVERSRTRALVPVLRQAVEEIARENVREPINIDLLVGKIAENMGIDAGTTSGIMDIGKIDNSGLLRLVKDDQIKYIEAAFKANTEPDKHRRRAQVAAAMEFASYDKLCEKLRELGTNWMELSAEPSAPETRKDEEERGRFSYTPDSTKDLDGHDGYEEAERIRGERRASSQRAPAVPPKIFARPSKYSTIFFDIGNVIVRFDHKSLARALAPYCAISDDREASEKAVYDLFEGYKYEYKVLFEKGEISPERFFEDVKKRLRLTINYEEFLPIYNSVYVSVVADTVEVIRQLKYAGYRIFIISNVNEVHKKHLLDTYKDIFAMTDGIIASCEVGTLKDDPRIFDEALRAANVAPEKAVFVDDIKEYVGIASSMEITGLQLLPDTDIYGALRKILEVPRTAPRFNVLFEALGMVEKKFGKMLGQRMGHYGSFGKRKAYTKAYISRLLRHGHVPPRALRAAEEIFQVEARKMLISFRFTLGITEEELGDAIAKKLGRKGPYDLSYIHRLETGDSRILPGFYKAARGVFQDVAKETLKAYCGSVVTSDREFSRIVRGVQYEGRVPQDERRISLDIVRRLKVEELKFTPAILVALRSAFQKEASNELRSIYATLRISDTLFGAALAEEMKQSQSFSEDYIRELKRGNIFITPDMLKASWEVYHKKSREIFASFRRSLGLTQSEFGKVVCEECGREPAYSNVQIGQLESGKVKIKFSILRAARRVFRRNKAEDPSGAAAENLPAPVKRLHTREPNMGPDNTGLDIPEDPWDSPEPSPVSRKTEVRHPFSSSPNRGNFPSSGLFKIDPSSYSGTFRFCERIWGEFEIFTTADEKKFYVTLVPGTSLAPRSRVEYFYVTMDPELTIKYCCEGKEMRLDDKTAEANNVSGGKIDPTAIVGILKQLVGSRKELVRHQELNHFWVDERAISGRHKLFLRDAYMALKEPLYLGTMRSDRSICDFFSTNDEGALIKLAEFGSHKYGTLARKFASIYRILMSSENARGPGDRRIHSCEKLTLTVRFKQSPDRGRFSRDAALLTELFLRRVARQEGNNLKEITVEDPYLLLSVTYQVDTAKGEVLGKPVFERLEIPAGRSLNALMLYSHECIRKKAGATGTRGPSVGHTEGLVPYVEQLRKSLEGKKYVNAFDVIMAALKHVLDEDDIDLSAVTFISFRNDLADFVTAVYHPDRAGPGYDELSSLLTTEGILELRARTTPLLPLLDQKQEEIKAWLTQLAGVTRPAEGSSYDGIAPVVPAQTGSEYAQEIVNFARYGELHKPGPETPGDAPIKSGKKITFVTRVHNSVIFGSWKEQSDHEEVRATIPGLEPNDKVEVSCVYLKYPPRGVEAQWLLMIETKGTKAKEEVYYYRFIKDRYHLQRVNIAPEAYLSVFLKNGIFNDLSISPLPGRDRNFKVKVPATGRILFPNFSEDYGTSIPLDVSVLGATDEITVGAEYRDDLADGLEPQWVLKVQAPSGEKLYCRFMGGGHPHIKVVHLMSEKAQAATILFAAKTDAQRAGVKYTSRDGAETIYDNIQAAATRMNEKRRPADELHKRIAGAIRAEEVRTAAARERLVRRAAAVGLDPERATEGRVRRREDIVKIGLPPKTSIDDRVLAELLMKLADDARDTGLDPATATRARVDEALRALAASVRLPAGTDSRDILTAVDAMNKRAVALGLPVGVKIDDVERAERVPPAAKSAGSSSTVIVADTRPPQVSSKALIPDDVRVLFREELKVVFSDNAAALELIEDDSWLAEKWSALAEARERGYHDKKDRERCIIFGIFIHLNDDNMVVVMDNPDLQKKLKMWRIRKKLPQDIGNMEIDKIHSILTKNLSNWVDILSMLLSCISEILEARIKEKERLLRNSDDAAPATVDIEGMRKELRGYYTESLKYARGLYGDSLHGPGNLMINRAQGDLSSRVELFIKIISPGEPSAAAKRHPNIALREFRSMDGGDAGVEKDGFLDDERPAPQAARRESLFRRARSWFGIPAIDDQELHWLERRASTMRDNGYRMIGGPKDYWAYRSLKRLTGAGILAYKEDVYSPHNEREDVFWFYDLACEKIKEAAPRIIRRGKDTMRVLVIGSGTGIDCLTAFQQIKSQGLNALIDAIDIDDNAVENTRFNVDLLLKGRLSKNDSINVTKVKEGEEFASLQQQYDLILFNAPTAISFHLVDPDDAPTDRAGAMEERVFKKILGGIEGHLSEDGVALVSNTIGIVDRGLVPRGLEVTVTNARRLLGSGDKSRVIFEFTRPPADISTGMDSDLRKFEEDTFDALKADEDSLEDINHRAWGLYKMEVVSAFSRDSVSDTLEQYEPIAVKKAGDAVNRMLDGIFRDIGYPIDEFRSAAQEWCRNAIDHGGGGIVTIRIIEQAGKPAGVEIVALDRGKGISNIKEAIERSLGLQSSGARHGHGFSNTMKMAFGEFGEWVIETRVGEEGKVYKYHTAKKEFTEDKSAVCSVTQGTRVRLTLMKKSIPAVSAPVKPSSNTVDRVIDALERGYRSNDMPTVKTSLALLDRIAKTEFSANMGDSLLSVLADEKGKPKTVAITEAKWLERRDRARKIISEGLHSGDTRTKLAAAFALILKHLGDKDAGAILEDLEWSSSISGNCLKYTDYRIARDAALNIIWLGVLEFSREGERAAFSEDNPPPRLDQLASALSDDRPERMDAKLGIIDAMISFLAMNEHSEKPEAGSTKEPLTYSELLAVKLMPLAVDVLREAIVNKELSMTKSYALIDLNRLIHLHVFGERVEDALASLRTREIGMLNDIIERTRDWKAAAVLAQIDDLMHSELRDSIFYILHSRLLDLAVKLISKGCDASQYAELALIRDSIRSIFLAPNGRIIYQLEDDTKSRLFEDAYYLFAKLIALDLIASRFPGTILERPDIKARAVPIIREGLRSQNPIVAATAAGVLISMADERRKRNAGAEVGPSDAAGEKPSPDKERFGPSAPGGRKKRYDREPILTPDENPLKPKGRHNWRDPIDGPDIVKNFSSGGGPAARQEPIQVAPGEAAGEPQSGTPTNPTEPVRIISYRNNTDHKNYFMELMKHFANGQKFSWGNKEGRVESYIKYDDSQSVFIIEPQSSCKDAHEELKVLDRPVDDIYVARPGSFGQIRAMFMNIDGKTALVFDEIQSSRGFRELAPQLVREQYLPWAEAATKEVINFARTLGIDSFYASHPDTIHERYKNKSNGSNERNLFENYTLPFKGKGWHPVPARFEGREEQIMLWEYAIGFAETTVVASSGAAAKAPEPNAVESKLPPAASDAERPAAESPAAPNTGPPEQSPADPVKTETVSEEALSLNAAIDADISDALSLKTTLGTFYENDHEKITYTIRLDEQRIPAEYIHIIQEHYVKILSSDKVEVKVLGNNDTTGLIDVSIEIGGMLDGKSTVGGKGHIESLGRLIGMVNLAISVATLPKKYPESGDDAYKAILDKVFTQYRSLTGQELERPINSKDIFSKIRIVVQNLPPVKACGTRSQEDFELMEKKLSTAA